MGWDIHCDFEGCNAEIDHRPHYRCGWAHDDTGCGGYFCADHLLQLFGGGARCPTCLAAYRAVESVKELHQGVAA